MGQEKSETFKGEIGRFKHIESDNIDTERASVGQLDTDEQSITNVETVLYLSANQTVSTATATKVAFDTAEDEDTAVLDADLTNNTVTVQQDGRYQISTQLMWSAASGWTTGDFANVNPKVNGTLITNPRKRKLGTGGEGKLVIWQGELSAGDVIRIDAYQDSGASKTLNSGSKNTRLQIARLG